MVVLMIIIIDCETWLPESIRYLLTVKKMTQELEFLERNSAIWEIPSDARVWGCLIRIQCEGDGDLRVEVLNLSFVRGSLMASAQVLPNSSTSSRKQEHLEAGKRRIEIGKCVVDLLNAVFSDVIMSRICARGGNVGSSLLDCFTDRDWDGKGKGTVVEEQGIMRVVVSEFVQEEGLLDGAW
ncbi:hypothetical protein V8G54_028707 [Vigna mungo]|uniref:Uncharacterized protein n=1 Tax=Vigna mungo TaxID=3915 RepID=A0AAQ3MSX9_VIGMU